MALLVPDVGEVRLLSYALNTLTPEDQILRLYKNNYTPVEGSVAADFTEATWTGYAEITLPGASWIITTVAGVTTGVYAAQIFTSSADQPVESTYGYYILGDSSGILLWAERFTDGPYLISVTGDTITVTPKITAA